MSRKSARLNSRIWLWQQFFFLTDRWASDTTPSKSAGWQSDLTAIFRPNILLVPGTASTWQEEKWFKEIRKEKDLALYSAIYITVKEQERKRFPLCFYPSWTVAQYLYLSESWLWGCKMSKTDKKSPDNQTDLPFCFHFIHAVWHGVHVVWEGSGLTDDKSRVHLSKMIPNQQLL